MVWGGPTNQGTPRQTYTKQASSLRKWSPAHWRRAKAVGGVCHANCPVYDLRLLCYVGRTTALALAGPRRCAAGAVPCPAGGGAAIRSGLSAKVSRKPASKAADRRPQRRSAPGWHGAHPSRLRAPEPWLACASHTNLGSAVTRPNRPSGEGGRATGCQTCFGSTALTRLARAPCLRPSRVRYVSLQRLPLGHRHGTSSQRRMSLPTALAPAERLGSRRGALHAPTPGAAAAPASRQTLALKGRTKPSEAWAARGLVRKGSSWHTGSPSGAVQALWRRQYT